MHHARFRTETTRAVYRQVRFCPTADVAAAVASALRARQGEAAEPRAVGARALGVAVVDAASLRDIARDVRSDRVLLNAGLSVASPQFQNQQKFDLSRIDVPTGISI